jgi:hypothetical protein
MQEQSWQRTAIGPRSVELDKDDWSSPSIKNRLSWRRSEPLAFALLDAFLRNPSQKACQSLID